MPIELDKGHEIPIFGPQGKLNMAERFELARDVVRMYGRRAIRAVASRAHATAARRGRRGKRHH